MVTPINILSSPKAIIIQPTTGASSIPPYRVKQTLKAAYIQAWLVITSMPVILAGATE
jgi:hypothetical protein